MANTKTKNKKKRSKKRNTPAVAARKTSNSAKVGSRPSLGYSKAKAANPKTKKKNTKRRARNPISLAGLKPIDLGAAAIALILTQALAQAGSAFVDPTSYLGIGVQIGMAALIARFAPRSVREAAVIGAGATPVANLVNRLTGNVIGNTVTNTVRGFLPARVPAPVPAPAAGMGRLVAVDAVRGW